LDLFGSAKKCCEDGNKRTGFIKGRIFIDQLGEQRGNWRRTLLHTPSSWLYQTACISLLRFVFPARRAICFTRRFCAQSQNGFICCVTFQPLWLLRCTSSPGFLNEHRIQTHSFPHPSL